MKDIFVQIPRRFRGPANSGNGGYVCGLVAEAFEGPCEVTLKRPPPLDVDMILSRPGGDASLVCDGVEVAHASSAQLDMDIPVAPDWGSAEAAVHRFVTADRHILPECFVCGPHRDEGDGLRLFTGAVDGRDMVAAPWRPEAQYAGEDGLIRDIFIWAALDCPSYFGLQRPNMLALLGRMKAQILKRPKPDDPCIVAGWCTGHEGRKYFAGSALYSKKGEILAFAQTIWIELKK